MTQAEQKTIDNLLKVMNDLRNENHKFREDVWKQIDAINTKTNEKHLPIYLEQDILKSAQNSINNVIMKTLGDDYNSPLRRLVTSVVDENSVELRKIISDSFTEVIRVDEFKQSIVNAFSHKVARSIISNNSGLFDKVANELKQDSVFKAKMALAVAKVVDECLIEK